MIVHSIKKRRGIAGQFSVTATVEYPDELIRTIEFIGSTYGGPVVMCTDGIEVFVTDPGRFGEFGLSWAQRFLEAT